MIRSTGARIAFALLALVLAALLAVGAWGDRPARPSDDHYISLALSQPEVFHPSGAGSGQRVVTTGVEHGNTWVAVNITSDGAKFRVLIDPRTDRVTQVIREP